jgi:hypothetical protein
LLPSIEVRKTAVKTGEMTGCGSRRLSYRERVVGCNTALRKSLGGWEVTVQRDQMKRSQKCPCNKRRQALALNCIKF